MAARAWLLGLVYVTVAVTIASGVDYFIVFRRRAPAEPVRVRAAAAGAESAAKRAVP